MTPIRETIARAILYDLDEHSAAYVGFDIDKMDEARVDGDCNFLSAADAVLRALDEAGMVVVPRDPSEAMVLAGFGKVEIDWYCAGSRDDGECCETAFPSDCLPDVYRAMIAASVVE